jgi:hypothetical protein
MLANLWCALFHRRFTSQTYAAGDWKHMHCSKCRMTWPEPTPPKDKLLTDVVERVARAMRFSTRPDGVEYEDTDETWDKLSHRAKSYWRDFARAAVEAAFVERQP